MKSPMMATVLFLLLWEAMKLENQIQLNRKQS